MLLIVGAVIIVLGLILLFVGKLPFLGRLPGDIRIERENLTRSFPIVASVEVGPILTLILSLGARLLNR